MSDIHLKTFEAVGRGAGFFRSAKAPYWRLSYGNIGTLVALLDFLAVVAACVVSGVGYHFIAYQFKPDIEDFIGIGIGSGIMLVLVAKSLGLYRITSLLAGYRNLQSIAFAWFAAVLLFAAFLFLLKIGDRYSRGAVVLFDVLALAFLILQRGLFITGLKDWLRQGTLAGWRAVVIGDAKELASLPPDKLLETQGASEIGRFELSDSPIDDLSRHDLGIIDDAIALARSGRAEKVLIALPWSDFARRKVVTEQLRVMPLPVLLLPDRVASSVLLSRANCSGVPLAIELSRAPLSTADRMFKRGFDIAVSLAALLTLSPLLLATALAVKLGSRGPALFRQDRVGFNGREFGIFKFRTMTVMENGEDLVQATVNDKRVTSIGRFLRAWSIDELPQLLNVLRGEMSLVGPRPHAVAHHNQYERAIATYAFRHNVKPGLTGWAQVNGLRGPTPRLELMARRVDHDIWYIANWSWWLDLQILARTCREVVRSQNAV